MLPALGIITRPFFDSLESDSLITYSSFNFAYLKQDSFAFFSIFLTNANLKSSLSVPDPWESFKIHNNFWRFADLY